MEYYPLFEKTNYGNICGKVRRFLVEDLNDCYSTLKELRANFYHVSVPKRKFSFKKLSSLKSYLHSFCKTDKVKGIPLSKDFIANVRRILNNTVQLHHSHVTGEIIGYTHRYCNQKIKEITSKYR